MDKAWQVLQFDMDKYSQSGK